MFSSEPESRLTVLSVKAMLATLCGGKLVDKLRCEYEPKASELTWSLCFHVSLETGRNLLIETRVEMVIMSLPTWTKTHKFITIRPIRCTKHNNQSVSLFHSASEVIYHH